ncbi:hypothetical protein [Bacillus thuringiensis]|uniref:hypothetical protein n=1 Tax=Bacillus thuringiensis TaxID=1428 RepID=UPI000BFC1990|nr:hypothetical protein [Bacillus thuringiensis]PGT89920.1 hypothetical protein COD17_09220 [Bacillus thuringiensis]
MKKLHAQLSDLEQDSWNIVSAKGRGVADYVLVKPSENVVLVGLVYGETEEGNPVIDGGIYEIQVGILKLHRVYQYMEWEDMTVNMLLSLIIHFVWAIEYAKHLPKIKEYAGKTKEDLRQVTKCRTDYDIAGILIHGRQVVWNG